MSGERRFGIEQGRRGVASVAAEIVGDWRRGDARVRALLAVAGLGGLALVGSTLFGIIHVVGGAWHGNGRAMAFGFTLASGSTALLAGLSAVTRAITRRDAS